MSIPCLRSEKTIQLNLRTGVRFPSPPLAFSGRTLLKSSSIFFIYQAKSQSERSTAMPSSKSYLDYILDQLSRLEDVSWRKMMGNTCSTIGERSLAVFMMIAFL